jgi:rubrerythrin
MAAQPAKVQTAPDETQFWVCPHCGNDTQMKDGRQYCSSCKIYL